MTLFAELAILFLGTRTMQGFQKSHPSSRFMRTSMTRDKGMSKLITFTGAATFSGSTISDSGNTFSGVFAIGDPIAIRGTASNDGERTILTVSTNSCTVDWPLVTETPPTTATMRTT